MKDNNNENSIIIDRPLGARLGEGLFCLIYLIYMVILCVILKGKYEDTLITDSRINMLRYGFGFMLVVLLAGGDAFHLIPRIIVDFRGNLWKKDFFFGLGSLISSITMTIFYNILIAMGDSLEYHESEYNYSIEKAILYLTIIRIIILLLPMNRWYSKEPNRKWAIIRNVPFVIIGIFTVVGFINVINYAGNLPDTFYIVIIITTILSFCFYIPVAIWGKEKPKTGMLMIPKTICYMVMLSVICFYK